VKLKEGIDLLKVFGSRDAYLRIIKENLGIKAVVRGNEIILEGPEDKVKIAEKIIQELIFLSERYTLRSADVIDLIKHFTTDKTLQLDDAVTEAISLPTKKRIIVPRSPVQAEYIRAIRNYDIVIGIGPAGTGKTYLAMAMAVSYLLNKEVTRIILARPAVEAGEKLGFLPGDIYEKVNPYLRPLYDALYDMMEMDRANRLIERGDIEIAPLAFMRGRTLNDSFIILDEAQNATSDQMKMFLTRLGFNSKIVITGDITQVDLPSDKRSGLIEIQEILKDIKGIKFVYFTEKDVVRHRLVQDIIKAYESFGTRGEKHRKS